MADIFKNKLPLLLASASPRRRELLSLLGLKFSVRAAKSESDPAPGESGPAYAARAAREKALAVLHELAAEWAAPGGAAPASAAAPTSTVSPASPTAAGAPVAPDQPTTPAGLALPLILAADTIVLLDGEIFGKPASPEHSLVMLKRLAGRRHQVITACHLLLPPQACNKLNTPHQTALPCGYGEAALAQSSGVTFWNAPEAALRAYANSGTTLDKAGSYAMQGEGAWLVRQVEGSWSNVVGLPLSELTEFLLERECIIPCDL